MKSTRVKICGITSTEDARLAESLGADYIGVIFAKSPRQIDVERAREIRSAVTTALVVGVFRDQDVDDVIRMTQESGIDLVQLHGRESPDYCNDVLVRTGKPVIKGFGANHMPDASELAEYTTTSYFLFDLPRGARVSAADVERVWTEVLRTRRKGFQVFVAGALNPANVREAIRRTHAFAVDVCRGVERAPGIKDPDTLQRFLTEARS